MHELAAFSSFLCFGFLAWSGLLCFLFVFGYLSYVLYAQVWADILQIVLYAFITGMTGINMCNSYK
jgi:hypothetical protein